MKICTSEKEYIEAIAPSVQKACKRYGYLPSVLIAQSCHENGYGIREYWDNPGIEQLLANNNMVGQKAELLTKSWEDKSVWPGKSFNKKTPEEYNGKMTTITDAFRIFDTIEQSFCDFLLFLKYASNYGKDGAPKYGDEVLAIKDPERLIRTVAGRGYATGSTYPSAVMKIINKHNLTKYDDLSKVTPSNCIPDSIRHLYSGSTTGVLATETGSSATKKLESRTVSDITGRNAPPRGRGSNPISYIVVHYLGVPNADNPDLYGGGYGGHYNVQRDGRIFKAADPRKYVVWHCGGGLQGSGGHTFYQKCTNFNSIGIECGVCYTGSSKVGDGDDNLWYFTEETQESLVWLVSRLMDEYGIGIDRVIRHYDVTGKICPNPYVKNNNLRTSWTWDQFKANLQQYRKDGTITLFSAQSGSAGGIAPQTKSYLSKGDKGDAVRVMQGMLIACGYSCGSAGADGDFGSGTDAALRKFQKAAGLSVDGKYGPLSKAALEKAYKAKTAKKSAADIFLDAVKAVADKARTEGWKYGNSTSKVPCDDKLISCDRLVARAAYDIGFKEQPQGGFTCGNISSYLQKFGFVKITDREKIRAGAVVAVRKKEKTSICHVFVVSSYDPKTGKCCKYDTGSNARIRTAQPFKGVQLVEWPEREFACAWNVPESLAGNGTDEKATTAVSTVYNGVNYSPVYNYTYYRKKYADLRKAFGTDKQAYFDHFCTYGMKEGRQGSAAFDVQKYRKRYEDLRKAFGSDLKLYYKHFVEFGKKEGRKAT